MADKTVVIPQHSLKPLKIVKWKVNEGNSISIGCVMLLYKVDGDDSKETLKLKSTKAGTVHRIVAQEGDVVKLGEPLLELKACIHPTVMKDMCAECGADLRKDDMVTTASVPMIHTVPELKVSLELAKKLGKADSDRLLKDRKLVLLVDLDQTLIHTTNDNIPANLKDVYHFQLYGANSPWYHTRLRPGTHRFLTNMSTLFELHICTFGARNYAHMIAMFLDQDGQLFSHRILSRDECFNPNSKTANLKALFPCGDNMVCIIDDREDVWSYASNLIHVKPYHFFQHTGDINAPPGLDKHEDDDKECSVDLSKVHTKKPVKVNGSSVEPNLEENKKESGIENVDNKNDLMEELKEDEEQINDTKDNEKESILKDACMENKKIELSEQNTCKNNDSEKPEIETKSVEIIEEKKKPIVIENDVLNEEIKIEINIEEKCDKTKDNKEIESKAIKQSEIEVHTSENNSNIDSENISNNDEKESEKNNIMSTKTTEDTIEKSNMDDMNEIKQSEESCSNENKQKEESNIIENRQTEESNTKENIQTGESNTKKNKQTGESNTKENRQIEESNTNENKHTKEESNTNESKELKESNMNENKQTEESNSNENKQIEESKTKENKQTEENKNEERKDELIEIEDPDDYLLYLEEILKIIHKAFYDKYDKLESGEVPDLKKVIPEVRGKILKGARLVFSGLVPTHIKLEQSKAYQVARSLGAVVTQDLEEDTTHLVAVRPGTAKVNVGRRRKSLKIVTPDWLWSCAERWEKVDERLYPLNNKGSKNRHPPPHCSSPEHIPNFDITEPGIIRKRTPSGRFMDTINPLMSFSSADIADMDREVEDIFNESESEGENSNKRTHEIENEEILLKKFKPSKESDDESSSSDESLTGEHPHGWNPNSNSRKRSREDQEQEAEDESTADEFPSTKFRRGEELSSDLEFGQDSNSEGSVDAPDEIDDGDWNMMGAALEREFLSNN